jgi:GTP-binding protein YchF
MQIGIVGLPNAGKSTLFNALTRAGAQVGNYAFTTIEPNHGIAPVPDHRLRALADLFHPQKYTPAAVEFLDIAGIVKGASKGEGLGNQFLGNIRSTDAVVHVVRCYPNPDMPDERNDPADDVDTILTELILADLQSVEKQVQKADREARKGGAEAKARLAELQALVTHLGAGKPAREMPGADARKDYFLLTDKPVLYVANVEEQYAGVGGSPEAAKLRAALPPDTHVLEISARIESELVDLDAEEAAVFMEELGITESGLDKLIRESYYKLGLISFLTVGEDECRAWTIKAGTRAQDAAGEIHSDISRGFIRAEILPWETLVETGSWAAAKEKGAARLEGRDYIMQDGDVVLFRFQV